MKPRIKPRRVGVGDRSNPHWLLGELDACMDECPCCGRKGDNRHDVTCLMTHLVTSLAEMELRTRNAEKRAAEAAQVYSDAKTQIEERYRYSEAYRVNKCERALWELAKQAEDVATSARAVALIVKGG